MAGQAMTYPTFHMMYFIDDTYRKGRKGISNAEEEEMIGPGTSICLGKLEDSQSLSNVSKGQVGKRKWSRSSESSPKRKRPQTSPSKYSQGSVQPDQLESDLPAKTGVRSPAVATASKVTSYQGEKATGSKGTASTASGATPSTSSESLFFIRTSDKKAIGDHKAAASLLRKVCYDRCIFGSEILKSHVAWQVNVEFRLITKPKFNKDVPICEVGFWTDRFYESNKVEKIPRDEKIVTLQMAAMLDDCLEFSIKGHKPNKKSMKDERNIKVGETVTVKIAFAWNTSKKAALIAIDRENPEQESPLEWELKLDREKEICPIVILEKTKKEEAVIAVTLKVGEEVDRNLKKVIERWAS